MGNLAINIDDFLNLTLNYKTTSFEQWNFHLP